MRRLLLLASLVLLSAQPAALADDATAQKEWALCGYSFGYMNGYRDGGQAIASAHMQSVAGDSPDSVMSSRQAQLDQAFAMRAIRLEGCLAKELVDVDYKQQAMLGFSHGYKEAVKVSAQDFSADLAPRINEGLPVKRGMLNARCDQRTKEAVAQKAARLSIGPGQVKAILKHASKW